ncbi:MAG TPA: peptide chain release factor N(5)-glutamine methyltransferase [Phycisphaerae bacterium]|jgi:release factor glutamine methyltransferase|nr:peptide chain release factor N(5)-glutamine methyltransferase [Phycisphaerae bacterium]HOB76581.1 peptide chain release factor N(5)-glutamine methyltransferase [Phycisphaerae bacterium]HPU34908.1 peptide chain release factor N(5)-glutamine methyltransferase [Phycisphaerae bacterium]HQA45801.1 peptide chain release factor N(5)-glutamine methyltransferase [Phycisphaerae bacterium]HQE45080.1 peptide chain release factor N(5)-glutamine methyltransferase [Phycisphaerae bacterium]
MSTPGTSERQAPWTVGRLLEWTTRWFQDRGVEGGRLAAELLLARAMGCKKIELYTRYEQEPTDEQRATFRELVRQAGEHTPIAYLLGYREFFSLEFKVTPAVLIPRPETEALVERVIGICRQEPDRIWRILDVGTGSGCIAVAVAKYAKNAQLVASDVSEEALAVAAENIQKHQLAERVRTVHADLADLPADAIPEGGFDLVVSNPPYISEKVFAELPPNVRNHEPRSALVGPNGDGLVMYRRFAAEAPAILSATGRLLVEVAHDQPEAAKAIFAEAGGWTFVAAHRDRTDPFDRVLEFVRS